MSFFTEFCQSKSKKLHLGLLIASALIFIYALVFLVLLKSDPSTRSNENKEFRHLGIFNNNNQNRNINNINKRCLVSGSESNIMAVSVCEEIEEATNTNNDNKMEGAENNYKKKYSYEFHFRIPSNFLLDFLFENSPYQWMTEFSSNVMFISLAALFVGVVSLMVSKA